MKLIFLFLFVPFFVVPVFAQENCGLQNAPALLGLKLNMSPEQIQSVLGKSLKIKAKSKGEYNFFQNYIEQSAPPVLAGVRALWLRFFNGRLYQIEVFYEENNRLKTLGDFTGELSAKFGFPALEWLEEYREAKITCEDFTITADKILNPHVEITDQNVQSSVIEIRKQKDN